MKLLFVLCNGSNATSSKTWQKLPRQAGPSHAIPPPWSSGVAVLVKHTSLCVRRDIGLLRTYFLQQDGDGTLAQEPNNWIHNIHTLQTLHCKWYKCSIETTSQISTYIQQWSEGVLRFRQRGFCEDQLQRTNIFRKSTVRNHFISKYHLHCF